MALHYVFIGFFGIAFAVALLRTLGYFFRDFLLEQFGWVFNQTDLGVFDAMVQSTFDAAETSIRIVIYLMGIMALWLGIMKIGEKGGAVNALGRLVNPFFRRLFPEIPDNHPASGSILMNFAANMLGLDNAATPLGLKAMEELQEINPEKDRASNAQIMFLVLNTSGLTIIPISVIALRAAAGAASPTDVFIPILYATYFATLAGLVTVSIYQKINLFQPVILGWLGGITALILLSAYALLQLDKDTLSAVTGFAGNFILFGIIIGFLWLGVRKKINIWDTFIDGAKEGFGMAVKIIPYLVGMLVAIGVFRASGAFDMLLAGITWTVETLGINSDFVPALPTALMKPLSGSGARGMMVEAMSTYGPDSFAGHLAAVFQGSTETTFYTVAVYFGAVNIKRTRYTIPAGLIADFTGIVAAIVIAYIFFY